MPFLHGEITHKNPQMLLLFFVCLFLVKGVIDSTFLVHTVT